MEERIYTIPVTEAFEKADGCPFCRLHKELDEAECDRIIGAAMMEPDTRIKTNELGFCRRHYARLMDKGNHLSLALMLESHLAAKQSAVAIKGKTFLNADRSKDAVEAMRRLSGSCYVCEPVKEKFEKMLVTAIRLYKEQSDFRALVAKTPYFCLPHAAQYIAGARAGMDKRQYKEFVETMDAVQSAYYASLSEDVSWFCKKFDYRYENEPWGNAKDAVERAVKFLSGDD